MYKETIISIVIIIVILILDYFTQNYTENRLNELMGKLESLKNDIIVEEVEKDSVIEKSKEIDEYSKEIHKKLAYYIEHDELEKVETDITSVKSFVELEDYEMAANEIDKSIFVIQHINDKYKLSIENIF